MKMKQIYQILQAKNFEQAVQKAQLIEAEVFIHGKASGYTDREIQASNLILQKQDRMDYTEYTNERSYTDDIHMYL